MKYHISDYNFYVPIGSNCRIAQALTDVGLRTMSFPLDWTLTSTKAIHDVFENRFEDYIFHESCQTQVINGYPHILNTRYNVNITHDQHIDVPTTSKYNKRISRLHEILASGEKVLLIRHYADGLHLQHDIIHSHYNSEIMSKGEDPNDIGWLINLRSMLSQRHADTHFDILVLHHEPLVPIPKIAYEGIQFIKTHDNDGSPAKDRECLRESLKALLTSDKSR
jgi:hypothetical protein